MTVVKDQPDLKKAIRSKKQEIKVVGNLALQLINEFENIEKIKTKKTFNRLSKLGFISALCVSTFPIALIYFSASSLGLIMTKDDYKKYDISMDSDTVTFTRKW